MLTEDEMAKVGKAALFLHLYANEKGCKSTESEETLKYVAELLPDYFTKDTKFERKPLKLVKPGEIPLSRREEAIDLLAYLMGEGTKLDLTVTYKDDENIEKTENISVPIKKHSPKDPKDD